MGKSRSHDPLQLFGENLRDLREAKGWSLRYFATECRIDYSDIAKIEKGQTNITILTILELSRALEVHPKRLFDFDIESND